MVASLKCKQCLTESASVCEFGNCTSWTDWIYSIKNSRAPHPTRNRLPKSVSWHIEHEPICVNTDAGWVIFNLSAHPCLPAGNIYYDHFCFYILIKISSVGEIAPSLMVWTAAFRCLHAGYTRSVQYVTVILIRTGLPGGWARKPLTVRVRPSVRPRGTERFWERGKTHIKRKLGSTVSQKIVDLFKNSWES